MMTFQEFMATFPDEASCSQFLKDRRWPDGVRCPRCGNEKVYTLKQPFKWQCQSVTCGKKGYRFSVLVGTIFENTNVPLVTWFKVLYTMLQSKKGISSRQLRRTFFGERSSLHTAWYVGHRLRAGMRDDDFKQLMGIVEVDETFIGGKDKNRHWDKKSHVTGGIGSGKVGVIGAISRKGNVVCQIIENTDAKTLNRFVRKTVSDRVSLVATDDHRGYDYLQAGGFPHGAVKHSENEYVRGNIHTNNIESFWALFKRGVIGTYHNVSKKYLPLYLNEFQFRHNNRKNPDIFGKAVAGC
jgi:transposase-like protein/transcription elongation factor Elf1